ncbi:hypothetical protein LIPSTDRAFT_67890 [Lipomyces starkeyi NRRL Y-11557]|uniref:Uncharacterized protein n=1 Tax=Lipomyces starkeyi NRRL Y-11557 TaxID=675824 RepID=A0A1E3QC96_LIPST|nr:hypothetical protein LIPSTDRAFT_67890 [Lipomyces starkeyi NRRL Y-11557]
MSYICLQQKPPYPTISPNFKKRIKKENAVRVPVSLATTPTLHSAIEISTNAIWQSKHGHEPREQNDAGYKGHTNISAPCRWPQPINAQRRAGLLQQCYTRYTSH